MNTVIIDYGAGNRRSVERILSHLGVQSQQSADPDVIAAADLLVLPGQGAFASAMAALEKDELSNLIRNHIKQGKPFLGICLGFQVLFEGSEEKGYTQGLGIFPGVFKEFSHDMPVPHMGWNTLNIKPEAPKYFQAVPERLAPSEVEVSRGVSDPSVYFVHSYYLDETNPNIVYSTTDYGHPFVSAIYGPNLLATQFHPEKSGVVGLALLQGFLDKIRIAA